MAEPSSIDALFAKHYYSRSGFVDGTTEFHAMCGAALEGAAAILEIGAGPSNATTRFLASIAPVVGLDVSPEVLENRDLASARTYDGNSIPFPDDSFDGCVSNYVLEHVKDPRAHFKEIARVLRPGGTYLFRTPNLFHYVASVSRLLPHAAHVRLSKSLRGLTSSDHDPWVTHYRANTPSAVRALARDGGLQVMEIRMVEKEPSYGRAGPFAFYPMMLYERVVNATPLAASLRANIFAVLRKPV
jgi:SAM-dependent methyltransferase